MTVSIRTVLVFGFCGLLALSLAAVILVGFAGAVGNTLGLVVRDSERTVDEAQRRLIAELAPIENQARYIARQFEVGDLDFEDAERLTLVLKASAAAMPDLAGLLLVDPTGRGYRIVSEAYANGGGRVTAGDFAAEPGLQEVIALARTERQSVWRRPAWIEEIGQPIINLHTPLRHEGVLIGLLIQGKAVADLSRNLIGAAGDGQTPFLLYGEDRVLAHPGLAELQAEGTLAEPLPPLRLFQDGILAAFPDGRPLRATPLLNGPAPDAAGLRLSVVPFRGSDYIFSATQLEGVAADRSITVGVYVNEAVYGSYRQRLYAMLGLGAAVLILSLALALWVARRTVRPIMALSEASQRIAMGDLDTDPPLPRSRMRELDQAGAAFRDMIGGLRERERIRVLFDRVVPAKIAERMLKSPAELEPQTAEATVLFCDLAGFTALTHKLGPDRVVGLLNAYFTDVVDIITRNDGIVTQFQGDAVLAVFNLPLADPDHALKAVDAALEIRAHLATRCYAQERLQARIGIATGPVVAANVGAAQRMNYTVHGDTVNLAARLEALNKETGTDILIDARTARMLSEAPNGAALRPLGAIEIRGWAHPVRPYTVAGDPVEAA